MSEKEVRKLLADADAATRKVDKLRVAVDSKVEVDVGGTPAARFVHYLSLAEIDQVGKRAYVKVDQLDDLAGGAPEVMEAFFDRDALFVQSCGVWTEQPFTPEAYASFFGPEGAYRAVDVDKLDCSKVEVTRAKGQDTRLRSTKPQDPDSRVLNAARAFQDLEHDVTGTDLDVAICAQSGIIKEVRLHATGQTRRGSETLDYRQSVRITHQVLPANFRIETPDTLRDCPAAAS